MSGLTAGSPVRYLGVDVGKVARITLEAPQRQRVEVIADIDETAPIDARTRALLSLQGVTGLLFIDLEEDPNSTASGPLPQGQHYPVIQSAPSDLGCAAAQAPGTREPRHRARRPHGPAVQRRERPCIQGHLAECAAGERPRADVAARDRRAGNDMKRASQDVDSAASDLRTVTNDSAPDLKATLANLRRLTASLASTSDRLDELVARNEPAISRFTGQGLPELERLLHESREAVRDIRDLSRSLKQNPAELLYESNSHGVELPR